MVLSWSLQPEHHVMPLMVSSVINMVGMFFSMLLTGIQQQEFDRHVGIFLVCFVCWSSVFALCLRLKLTNRVPATSLSCGDCNNVYLLLWCISTALLSLSVASCALARKVNILEHTADILSGDLQDALAKAVTHVWEFSVVLYLTDILAFFFFNTGSSFLQNPAGGAAPSAERGGGETGAPLTAQT